MTTTYTDIFDYITQNEEAFTRPIDLYGWEWSFKNHIKTSFFYKNGRLLNGNEDDIPVKNIVLPIRNLQDRAEDIDVKDINIYADDPQYYHFSFLIKKYHDDIFTKDNDLDTFFDEAKEEKNDYGVTLVEKMTDARPRKVSLQNIAFCDQSDILSAPFAVKFNLSPDELKEMESKGWGSKKYGATATIDEVIIMAEYEKTSLDKQVGKKNKSPGKNLEIYQVYGILPSEFLEVNPDQETMDTDFTRQLHYVTYVQKENGDKRGITLFNIKITEEKFKVFKRDNIDGRAAGRGAVEELFEDQVWTNSAMIHKRNFLDSASKTILKTTDSVLAAKHPSGLKNLDNLELLEVEAGKDVSQIDTFPRNYALFDKAVDEWQDHAMRTGGATEALLGENPKAGTPFRLENLVTKLGQTLHTYRQGKYVKFIEEIYQDWIIPHISKQITKGKKFLSELSSEQLDFVIERISENQANKQRNEMVLNGEIPTDKEMLKQQIQEEWRKRGNVLLIEVLKNELKNVPLKVKISIAGKQKDLGEMTDKLANIFKTIIANPQGFIQVMQIPAAAKAFYKMIEYSGLESADFQIKAPPQQQLLAQPPQQAPQARSPELAPAQ